MTKPKPSLPKSCWFQQDKMLSWFQISGLMVPGEKCSSTNYVSRTDYGTFSLRAASNSSFGAARTNTYALVSGLVNASASWKSQIPTDTQI